MDSHASLALPSAVGEGSIPEMGIYLTPTIATCWALRSSQATRCRGHLTQVNTHHSR